MDNRERSWTPLGGGVSTKPIPGGLLRVSSRAPEPPQRDTTRPLPRPDSTGTAPSPGTHLHGH